MKQCFRQKRVLWLFLILGFLWTFFTLKWKIYCLPGTGRDVVKTLCEAVAEKRATGRICNILCNPASEVTCTSYHGGKSHVLKVESNSESYILKSTSVPDFSSWEPTLSTEDLLAAVLTKLTLDFPLFSPNNFLSYVKSNDLNSSVIRQELWRLANDHEVLLALTLKDFGIFPTFLGHCGSFYAVEYVETLDKIAEVYPTTRSATVKAVEDVVKFLKMFRVGQTDLFLCDVKASHFGRSRLGDWKYVDLDSVFPKAMLERNIQLRSSCKPGSGDCDFFDCQSDCNPITNKCDQRISSSNLQIFCKNILMGGVWFGRGLLRSGKFAELEVMLKKCMKDPEFDESGLLSALQQIL